MIRLAAAVLTVTLLSACSDDARPIPSRVAVRGTLIATGGPSPGVRRPTPGEVVVVRRGVEVARIEVPSSGEFATDLEPGGYVVRATFGNDLPCGDDEDLDVSAGEQVTLRFVCVMR